MIRKMPELGGVASLWSRCSKWALFKAKMSRVEAYTADEQVFYVLKESWKREKQFKNCLLLHLRSGNDNREFAKDHWLLKADIS